MHAVKAVQIVAIQVKPPQRCGHVVCQRPEGCDRVAREAQVAQLRALLQRLEVTRAQSSIDQ